jgi:hypothetical protein
MSISMSMSVSLSVSVLISYLVSFAFVYSSLIYFIFSYLPAVSHNKNRQNRCCSDTVCQIKPTRTDMANSNVVKTPKKVLCSSFGGVPKKK